MALPSLRQLRYLCALADTLHFGKAAAACAVTQSTLSAGLQELEAGLGATLVERTRRKVLLTPLGREVVERARSLLREAEDLAQLARAGSEPLSGDLRLGIIPTIGPYVLPALMPLLRERHPRLRPYLREEQTAPLLEQVEAGRLDAAVIALPYDTGGLATMTFASDEILLVCPATHRLAACSTVATTDLEQEDLLLLEDGHCLRRHALRACQLDAPRGREVHHGTSLRTLVPMVASGLGVTLLPRSALPAELPHDGALVAKPLEGPARRRDLALAWRRTSARPRDFQLLADSLKDAAQALG
jgi:LysR family hydrogen peroxide-inducible transcriptional activator